jgi:acetoin utilization protein AcuC
LTRAASEPLPCAFLYDETLGAYELSESHPFRPERIEATRSLLQAVGVLHESDERRPARLALGPLERVHEPAYVETVRALSRGEEVPDAFGFGLGTSDNPVFPSMHEAVLRVCDATVSAVDLVASGAARRAVTLSGGLHHAFPGRASGFCVYNDLALAIEHATRRYGPAGGVRRRGRASR